MKLVNKNLLVKVGKKKSLNFIRRSYTQQVQAIEDYNAVLRSALESNSLGRIDSTLTEMNEKGIKANEITRSLIIEFANQKNDVNLALQQFEELSKSKNEIPNQTFSSLLSVIAKNKAANSVSKVFSAIKKPNFKHYELAIKSFAESGDSQSAVSFYQKMKKENVYINAPTYASLMKLSANKKDVNSTVAYWQELKEKGLYPNLHHFDSLLFLYSSVGDSQGIKNTIKEIDNNDILPQGVSEQESFTVSFVKKAISESKNAPPTQQAPKQSAQQAPKQPPQQPPQQSSKGHQSDSEKKKSKKTK